jgi:hypothetical protein
MIQPLRKIHRRVFFLLTLALPIFFFAGIYARHRMLPTQVSPKKVRSLDPAVQTQLSSQNRSPGAIP